MPHTGNVQFFADEELLNDTDQLHRQKPLIAAETVRILQEQHRFLIPSPDWRNQSVTAPSRHSLVCASD